MCRRQTPSGSTYSRLHMHCNTKYPRINTINTYPHASYHNQSKNYGQHNAIRTLIRLDFTITPNFGDAGIGWAERRKMYNWLAFSLPGTSPLHNKKHRALNKWPASDWYNLSKPKVYCGEENELTLAKWSLRRLSVEEFLPIASRRLIQDLQNSVSQRNRRESISLLRLTLTNKW